MWFVHEMNLDLNLNLNLITKAGEILAREMTKKKKKKKNKTTHGKYDNNNTLNNNNKAKNKTMLPHNLKKKGNQIVHHLPTTKAIQRWRILISPNQRMK